MTCCQMYDNNLPSCAILWLELNRTLVENQRNYLMFIGFFAPIMNWMTECIQLFNDGNVITNCDYSLKQILRGVLSLSLQCAIIYNEIAWNKYHGKNLLSKELWDACFIRSKFRCYWPSQMVFSFAIIFSNLI